MIDKTNPFEVGLAILFSIALVIMAVYLSSKIIGDWWK